ncbi:carbohydrate ABC transporter permease [Ruminococcaceae bacterium OttesenSCG-928-I18]|nr:carbohydrate ABC transporter permease [Ruminococcaceae bacterium OttesenSCG-928-I18]
MSMRKSHAIAQLMLYVFIVLFLVISLFPFFWILVTSFKPEAEVMGAGAFRIIAENPTVQNYVTVIAERGMLMSIKNSFIVSGVCMLYVVAVASMSAYIISRFNFRGKALLMGLILSVSMFPQMIVVGPLFNMYYNLGILNSYWITLAYSTITLPSAVWIMVTHFKQVPLALEEAAKIDGCTIWGTLWRIIFPLAAPGVATTAIMTFIAAWNEYLLSYTMNIDYNYQTVPVRIGYLRTQFTIFWSEISAATIVVTIPTLIIVLIFQKQIVAGIVNGAVKE